MLGRGGMVWVICLLSHPWWVRRRRVRSPGRTEVLMDAYVILAVWGALFS